MDLMSGSLKVRLKHSKVKQIYQRSSSVVEDEEAVALWKSDVVKKPHLLMILVDYGFDQGGLICLKLENVFTTNDANYTIIEMPPSIRPYLSEEKRASSLLFILLQK
ncbi:hypothetical protein T11_5918 [Trichinella zimbabwensis]|uniref:Uncharacterized protein n=1 Tax=Trichinella zimbabwensis TaxID=268475 RepID=A0A0V1H8N3_9BILA|nr:hypothetical protein T11_5918 [Trichinella zimbabwensis]